MILYHDHKVLAEDNNFRETYGQLYLNSRYATTSQRLFTPILFLRRFLIIMLCLVIQDIPGIFQLFGIVTINFLSLFYNGYADPFANLFDKILLQYNDFMVALCTYMVFTVHPDWNMVGEDRVFYSWFLVVLIQILIFINMIIIFKKSFKSIYLLLKKYQTIKKIRGLFKNI